jgi:prepilin-type N-terminal cleavage/methylation domain-containing protein/prepilin-type processing-associated H-X9-DG protein
MNKKGAFTLIELLVVISVIALLLAILFPVLGRAREAGRRTVCLSNLKLLQLAWIAYAENNNERIVLGRAISHEDPNGEQIISFPLDQRRYLIGWTWYDGYINIHPTPYNEEKEYIESFKRIKFGKLYPYVGNVEAYRCPGGIKREIRTYCIVDSMNGVKDPNVVNHNLVGGTKLWIQNRMDIKNPAARMVFLDAGMRVQESFSTYYDVELWKYGAPNRHSNGNTFSFADGHAEYWKWQGKDTITNSFALNPNAHLTYDPIAKKWWYFKLSSLGTTEYVIDIKPTTKESYTDLHRFQKAVWGRLGYAPTPTE